MPFEFLSFITHYIKIIFQNMKIKVMAWGYYTHLGESGITQPSHESRFRRINGA